jgi:hypothetical protein
MQIPYKLVPPESRVIYNHLKQSAKKRGIAFTLTISDIYNLDYPISCPILGIPLHWYYGKAQDGSYSFDRIDSTQGYNIDNIQILSFKANRSKNNLSDIELKKFSQFYQ